MKQRPLRIFISGPYTAETADGVLDNVHRALDAVIAVGKKGHYPYCPHTSHWIEKRAIRTGQDGFPWAWYLKLNRYWLDACDALLYLAPSKGADLELAWAQEGGLRVFTSVEQVPEVRDA